MINKNSKLMMLMALAATSINATNNIDAEGVAALLEAEREEAAKLEEASKSARFDKIKKAVIAGTAVAAGVVGAVVARKALRKSPIKPSATETVALEASHPDILTIDQDTPVAVKAPGEDAKSDIPGEDVTGDVTLLAGKPDEEPKVEVPVVLEPETETLHHSVEAPTPVDPVVSQPTATPVRKSFKALVLELARKHERTVAATITALLTVGSLGTAYHLASTTTPSEMLPCDVPNYGPLTQEVASNVTGAVAQFCGPTLEMVRSNVTALIPVATTAAYSWFDSIAPYLPSFGPNSTSAVVAPLATVVEEVALPITNLGTPAIELPLVATEPVGSIVRPNTTIAEEICEAATEVAHPITNLGTPVHETIATVAVEPSIVQAPAAAQALDDEDRDLMVEFGQQYGEFAKHLPSPVARYGPVALVVAGATKCCCGGNSKEKNQKQQIENLKQTYKSSYLQAKRNGTLDKTDFSATLDQLRTLGLRDADISTLRKEARSQK